VDLPGRSFDDPGVAPPLILYVLIGLTERYLELAIDRQYRGGDATITRHYFSATLFSVTCGHCRRRTSCVTVTAICYARDLSRTEFFLAVYSVHQ